MPTAAIAPIAGGLASGTASAGLGALLSRGNQPGGQQGAAYVPQGQPGADVNYQNLVQSFINPYTQGLTPAQVNFPAAQNITNALLDSSYAFPAIQGAGQGSQIAQGSLYPISPVGPAGGAYQNLANIAGNFPSLGTFEGGITTGSIPGLRQAEDTILQTGYDPQNALYQQLAQQTQQNAAASNAAAGLGSSPYGAGLQSQAMNNFNIGWQNQQLGRQAQAAQTAQQLASGIGNLAGTGFNQVITGAQAMPQVFSGITGLGNQMANLMASGTALPYQTQLGQFQNDLSALGQTINQGQQQYMLPQWAIQDLGNYITLGRAGSALAYPQTQGQLQGLGQLGQAGSNLLFGNQGLSGALGINPQTGILGSLSGLFGGGNQIPYDPTQGIYSPGGWYGEPGAFS